MCFVFFVIWCDVQLFMHFDLWIYIYIWYIMIYFLTQQLEISAESVLFFLFFSHIRCRASGGASYVRWRCYTKFCLQRVKFIDMALYTEIWNLTTSALPMAALTTSPEDSVHFGALSHGQNWSVILWAAPFKAQVKTYVVVGFQNGL